MQEQNPQQMEHWLDSSSLEVGSLFDLNPFFDIMNVRQGEWHAQANHPLGPQGDSRTSQNNLPDNLEALHDFINLDIDVVQYPTESNVFETDGLCLEETENNLYTAPTCSTGGNLKTAKTKSDSFGFDQESNYNDIFVHPHPEGRHACHQEFDTMDDSQDIDEFLSKAEDSNSMDLDESHNLHRISNHDNSILSEDSGKDDVSKIPKYSFGYVEYDSDICKSESSSFSKGPDESCSSVSDSSSNSFSRFLQELEVLDNPRAKYPRLNGVSESRCNGTDILYNKNASSRCKSVDSVLDFNGDFFHVESLHKSQNNTSSQTFSSKDQHFPNYYEIPQSVSFQDYQNPPNKVIKNNSNNNFTTKFVQTASNPLHHFDGFQPKLSLRSRHQSLPDREAQSIDPTFPSSSQASLLDINCNPNMANFLLRPSPHKCETGALFLSSGNSDDQEYTLQRGTIPPSALPASDENPQTKGEVFPCPSTAGMYTYPTNSNSTIDIVAATNRPQDLESFGNVPSNFLADGSLPQTWQPSGNVSQNILQLNGNVSQPLKLDESSQENLQQNLQMDKTLSQNMQMDKQMSQNLQLHGFMSHQNVTFSGNHSFSNDTKCLLQQNVVLENEDCKILFDNQVENTRDNVISFIPETMSLTTAANLENSNPSNPPQSSVSLWENLLRRNHTREKQRQNESLKERPCFKSADVNAYQERIRIRTKPQEDYLTDCQMTLHRDSKLNLSKETPQGQTASHTDASLIKLNADAYLLQMPPQFIMSDRKPMVCTSYDNRAGLPHSEMNQGSDKPAMLLPGSSPNTQTPKGYDDIGDSSTTKEQKKITREKRETKGQEDGYGSSFFSNISDTNSQQKDSSEMAGKQTTTVKTDGDNVGTSQVSPMDKSLTEAYQKATRTGDLMPMIKQELKRKIMYERSLQGKGDIEDDVPPKPVCELTPEEKEKIRKKKERNRVAASKHRKRKKVQMEVHVQSLDELEKTNLGLKKKVDEMTNEKNFYIQALAKRGFIIHP